MTKKDYIRIAGVIRDTKQTYSPTSTLQRKCIDDMALALSEVLQADNPRFNKETFINYINN